MTLEENIQDISSLGGLPFFLVMIAGAAFFDLKLAFLLIAGLVCCYAAIALIRLVWFRNRPKPEKYTTFWGRIDASSFPSLHAMRAAFLSTLGADIAGYSAPAIALALIATSAVMWARVRKKRHFASDVIFGALLGIILGAVVIITRPLL
jgi:membrane-associated phospholipid phosphatase